VLYASFIGSCILWIGIKEEVILVSQKNTIQSVAVGKD
jgi:hypothetical protein